MPLLEANDGITVEINDPLGNIGFARFNHLLPPFDKAEVRRAAIMAMKQEDYMTGAVGDQKFWKTCYSVYPCGTPLENDKGSDVMARPATLKRPRQHLKPPAMTARQLSSCSRPTFRFCRRSR
jgi:ABC-type transport system substrate-binding protein